MIVKTSKETSVLIMGILVALLVIAVQCGSQATPPTGQTTKYEINKANLTEVKLAEGERLRVVATTSLIGDMVKNIGGELLDLSVLLPVGTDPHAFEPTPRDLATVADAHVVFANGLGLEGFLAEMLNNAGSEAAVVAVSDGVELREFDGGEDHDQVSTEEHDQLEGADPHVWTTPANAIVLVHNIELALSALDPANSETYQANADTYTEKLRELDGWVKTKIGTIPTDNRKLVTDHKTFGYYADRYGLQQIGAVIPAVSTTAEPSAQDLAKLEEAIKEYQVKAIFVGTSVNPALSQRVADDTGIGLVTLYTGSLGPSGSGADTYLDYIRYNTNAIVESLK